MTPIEPNVAETGRYNISQTAKLLGMGRNNVARHIKNGNMRFGMHRYGQHKVFVEGREILRFWRARL